MLTLESLSVHYGSIAAVRDVSLDVRAGEILSVIGPNGAGKSSLLRAIAGLEPARTGSIRFDGVDITRLPAHKRPGLGLALAPEGRGIFPDQSVLDNLRLGALAARASAREQARRLDAQYALFPRLAERRDQMAGTLSGGEQQMLAIARALMGAPRLLLLDEPSLGLAPLVIKEIFHAIAALRQQGITIILVEQMANQALSIADRACLLETGALTRIGESSVLKSDPMIRAAYLGIR